MESIFKVAEITISYKPKLRLSEVPEVKSSKDCYNTFVDKLRLDSLFYKEKFFVMVLNNGNKVMGIAKISEGGINGTTVDVRQIFQHSLRYNATAIILMHNHPSGTLRPSNADMLITQKIKKAGETLDIKVLDHLIISPEGGYYSFADEGSI